MKDLNEYVDQLCAELTELKCERWPHCAEDGAYYVAKAGRKYIKIVSYDDSNGGGGSVWGFINKSEWTKPSGITFKCGDVLMSAGWATPALNAPRGNLFEGYKITGMRKYGPDYLR